MTGGSPREDSAGALRFRKAFLLLLAIGISILFLLVIRRFILAVLLAAVFAGLAYPLYGWVLNRLGGRSGLASVTTILILLLGVGIPLAGILGLVAAQAVQVAQGAEPWFQEQADRLDELRSLVDGIPFLENVPFAEGLVPDREQLAQAVREVAGQTGSAMMGVLAAAGRETANFVLQLFILLYALFYFLKDGPRILATLLHYIPLHGRDKDRLLERFVSVARATIRGSLLIGIIQGGAAGLAFWAAGVPGPAFWGTIMVVLSIIPAVGAALVWVPAVAYLFLVGQIISAIGLLIWSAVVVSTLDNFLRPRLVGRDARMSDLLILLSTLGGIVLFGVVGFIVGPIVAALFVTIWSIYGEVFRDWLPEGAAGMETALTSVGQKVGDGEADPPPATESESEPEG